MLSNQKSESDLSDLSTQIHGLKEVSSVLREYSEVMMEKLDPDNYQEIIGMQNQKLNDSLIERFNDEPMIHWLMDRKPKGVGIKTLFTMFQEANDIKELVEKANFNDEVIEEISVQRSNLAKKDFDKLKKEYS